MTVLLYYCSVLALTLLSRRNRPVVVSFQCRSHSDFLRLLLQLQCLFRVREVLDWMFTRILAECKTLWSICVMIKYEPRQSRVSQNAQRCKVWLIPKTDDWSDLTEYLLQGFLGLVKRDISDLSSSAYLI